MSEAETTQRVERPLVAATSLTEPFWQAAAEERLVAQRCDDCGRIRHYPRPMCPGCRSMSCTWTELSGRGEIYTYTVTHRPFHPFWQDRAPYVVATIELEEGIRMVSDMPGLDADSVAIGLAVEVAFEVCGDGRKLPVFGLVGG